MTGTHSGTPSSLTARPAAGQRRGIIRRRMTWLRPESFAYGWAGGYLVGVVCAATLCGRPSSGNVWRVLICLIVSWPIAVAGAVCTHVFRMRPEAVVERWGKIALALTGFLLTTGILLAWTVLRAQGHLPP